MKKIFLLFLIIFIFVYGCGKEEIVENRVIPLEEITAQEKVRIKKIMLNRLNKIQRTKYLNALEEYQKRKKISQKIKREIESLVLKTLPDSSPW